VLQPALEESNEYVEDPKNQIAVSLGGRPLRMKIKVTLSYSPGSNPVSPHFKSVQLNIECDKQSVWCENPVHQFETISFEQSSTPIVVQTYMYPLRQILTAQPI
jgi:hypothetical protein